MGHLCTDKFHPELVIARDFLDHLRPVLYRGFVCLFIDSMLFPVSFLGLIHYFKCLFVLGSSILFLCSVVFCFGVILNLIL